MDYNNYKSLFLFCVLFNFIFTIVAAGSTPELPRDHRYHKNAYLLPRFCGHQLNKDRIHNGKETAIYEYPWMAALKMATGKFDCGGSLITNRFILTAAHCVEQNDIVGVRLGQRDFDKDPDCDIYDGGLIMCAPPYQDLEIARIIMHPRYIFGTLLNDLALVKLKAPALLNAAVAPICLPITMSEKLNPATTLTVIGWGLTELNRKSTILMKAQVPLQNLSKCPGITSRFAQICAGGKNGSDACYGDSGAPLMAEFVDSGQLKVVQYGLVSNGALICGEEGSPTTYTNVAAYVGWILDNLSE